MEVISTAFGSYNNPQGIDRPNITVLESQLRDNETMLFGQVDEVTVEQLDPNLKGFQYFKVKLKVHELWSKKSLKLRPHYTFVFGTMIDQSNMQTSMPVKRKENLMIVLDSYAPQEVRMLKDNLLNIYEHHHEKKTGKEYFVSKITKHYTQKNLILPELQRLAYLEKMKMFSLPDSVGKNDSVLKRSIASETTSNSYNSEDLGDLGFEEHAEVSPHLKRRPNSSIDTQEEEFSVFGLLLVLVFLAIFSHFVIKYYETPDEEI